MVCVYYLIIILYVGLSKVDIHVQIAIEEIEAVDENV
jgi:hypothetical protein